MNLEFFSNRAEDTKYLRNRTTSSTFAWKKFLIRTMSAMALNNAAHIDDGKEDEPIYAITKSGATDTGSILNIRKNKYYRFLAICAYVLVIWTIKRLQRKAMIEGTMNRDGIEDTVFYFSTFVNFILCTFSCHSLLVTHRFYVLLLVLFIY